MTVWGKFGELILLIQQDGVNFTAPTHWRHSKDGGEGFEPRRRRFFGRRNVIGNFDVDHDLRVIKVNGGFQGFASPP